MQPASVTFVPGERRRPDWIRNHPRAWLAAVGTVCFGAFMGQLDASVVALTYHSIGHTFDAGLQVVQWISLSYLITLAALLVPLGRLSDRLGRKRVYLWGFGVFTVASLGCALAPNLGSLVVLRAAQGVGAAMLQANSVALVSVSAPAGRLRSALGLQAAAQAIGLALGPTVGGAIVQIVGWRWVFALNVPVGLVAIVAGRYLLPRTRINPDEPPGGTLREVFGRPEMPRNLTGALFAYLVLFGPIVLVPAVLQDAGVAPLTAGLVVAALPVGFALGALVAGRIRTLPGAARPWSTRARCRSGITLALVGLAGLLLLHTNLAIAVAALAVIGSGLGVHVPANNAQIMSAVPHRIAALTGGLISSARAVGTAGGTAAVAFGLAVAGTGSAVGMLACAAALVWLTAPRRGEDA